MNLLCLITSTPATLLEHFTTLDDSRIERNKKQLLLNIIGITICAVICGADSWVDIEKAMPKLTGLSSFLPWLMAFWSTTPLLVCLLSWIEALSQLSNGQIMASDAFALCQFWVKLTILSRMPKLTMRRK